MPQLDLESELLEFISNGGFKPGDRLPTIAELKNDEFLGLSVSKIREQLEVARSLGLVEVRSKTGMRLREYSFTPAVRLSLFYALANDLSVFEFFGDLRKHLEISYWNEACALLTQEDLDAMEACIQQALHKLNHDWIQIPYQEHRQFHLRIFRHLENPFVQGLLEAYWDAYEAVEINRYADYDYMQTVWDYHRRILDEICAGNFDAAKIAFIEHTQLLRVRPQGRLNGDAQRPLE